jgi:IS5 family transposase
VGISSCFVSGPLFINLNSHTVKQGQPHYGYKAHVAVDETHTLIRAVTLTAANVHDSQEFETVVKGDEGW